MGIEDKEALQRKIDEGLQKEKAERKKLMKEKKKKERESFFAGFKAFISRGNVIDMAVGVVIGGAFGKIVTGLVNYIINPCISLLTGGMSLDKLRTPLGEITNTYATIEEAVESGLNYIEQNGVFNVYETYIEWGLWIQTIVDFLIVAFCIYCAISAIGKATNAMNKKKIEAKAAADAAAAEAKAAADAAAAEAAAKAAEEEAAFRAAIVKQTELLAEIKDIMNNK